MKIAVALLSLALASQCLANPINDVFRDMIADVVTYIKQRLTAQDPILLDDFKNRLVQDWDLNFTVSLTNNKFYKTSKFQVKEVTTRGLKAKIQVDFPELVLTSDFEISGTAYNKTMGGSGTLSVVFKDVGQRLNVSVRDPTTEVQIRTLNLECDLGSVKVSETGFEVEGMTAAEAAVFLQEKLSANIFQRKDFFFALVSGLLGNHFDASWNGKTLQDVAAEVHSLVHN